MPCVLGLDIGTTSTICILVRLPDQVVSLVSRPARLHAPQPGCAEEDTREWWSNVCAIARELMAAVAPAGAEEPFTGWSL